MLTVRDLQATYQGVHGHPVHAVQGVSFEVPAGKIFSLVGPSGCGKTTTMRSIAGLERPSGGEVLVKGRVLFSKSDNVFVPPNKRNIGMVFQSYAIWPHLTVFENAAFPLRVRKGRMTKKVVDEKVLRVLSTVGLDAMAGREATMLSGGQQQRLALARALVMEPELLLLDEPLSNLDAKLRERMRLELKRMQNETGLTTIYVTHDQLEALALSHEIAVMVDGRIVQRGTPREIYERPASPFVADFIGSTNFLHGTVRSELDGAGQYCVDTASGVLEVHSDENLHSGEEIVVSIRPEQVGLSPLRPEGPNALAGTVEVKAFLGEFLDYEVLCGEKRILARVHPSRRNLHVGDSVYVHFPPSQCLAMRRGA